MQITTSTREDYGQAATRPFHRKRRHNKAGGPAVVQRGIASPPASVDLFRALDLVSDSNNTGGLVSNGAANGLLQRPVGQHAHKSSANWSENILVHLKRLDLDIRARLNEVMPAQSDKDLIEACMRELVAAMPKDEEDRWSIEMFGSAANGFGVASSDIDVTALFARRNQSDDRSQFEPEMLLRRHWKPILRDHPRFAVVEEILSAKVPILKVQFDDRLELDLSCQNSGAVRNTRLLKAYANMDQTVKELGIAVKLWAKAAGVCGAQKRHLSSYTFTLLTIYFLQVNNETHMPCLPVAAFEDGGAGQDDPAVKAAQSWVCGKSVADLLVSFFLWFTYSFGWGSEVVSIRLGKRGKAEDPVFEKLRGRWAWRIHAEDPYELDRNLHCVLGEDQETRLRLAMAEAVQALQRLRAPVGLSPLRESAAEQPPEAVEPQASSNVESVKDGYGVGVSRRNGRVDSSNIGTDSTISGGCCAAGGAENGGGSSDLDAADTDVRGRQCGSSDDEQDIGGAAAWLRRGLRQKEKELAAADNVQSSGAGQKLVDQCHTRSPPAEAMIRKDGGSQEHQAAVRQPMVEMAAARRTTGEHLNNNLETSLCRGSATDTPSGKASSKASSEIPKGSGYPAATAATRASEDDDQQLGSMNSGLASPDQRAQGNMLYGEGPEPSTKGAHADAKQHAGQTAAKNQADDANFSAKSTVNIATRVNDLCKAGLTVAATVAG